MFHGLVTKISTLPFRFAIMVRFQMRVAVRSKVSGIHLGPGGVVCRYYPPQQMVAICWSRSDRDFGCRFGSQVGSGGRAGGTGNLG